MNISQYDFHDGYLIDIKHYNDRIELSMESAQVDYDDIKNGFPLSNHDTLKGKLHFEKIRQIKVDNNILSGRLKKLHDEGDIFSIDIADNKVELTINWIPHSPNTHEENIWCAYEIEAEKIFWENIPDLFNPYWD